MKTDALKEFRCKDRAKTKEIFGAGVWTHYGFDYCSFLVAKHIHPLLDVPAQGTIVQIGCGLGLAVEKLCELYGEDRVVGFDWLNPLNHPRIEVLDCSKLDRSMEIAFCEIDVAAASTHPELRLHCLEWAINNLVEGGIILFNNNFASKHYGFDIEKYVADRGFLIRQLSEYKHPALLENELQSRVNSKMICTKVN